MAPRTQRRIFAAALATALAALLWAGCSGGSGSHSSTGTPSTPGATQPAGASGGKSKLTTTLHMGTGSAKVGSQTTVQLQALAVGEPGLGAWTLEVAFDQKVVSVVTCAAAPEPSVCNPKRNDHTVRMAGASGTGVKGDFALATVTFKCEAAGTSILHVSAEVLADGTIGSPLPIHATFEDGSLICS